MVLTLGALYAVLTSLALLDRIAPKGVQLECGASMSK